MNIEKVKLRRRFEVSERVVLKWATDLGKLRVRGRVLSLARDEGRVKNQCDLEEPTYAFDHGSDGNDSKSSAT